MKLGIMQPYFFPYLGYYSLIKSTDKFILFDTVQFIRGGWINRNRILKPTGGWQYISVPLVKFEYTTPIKDVKIRNIEDWKGKILKQLEHYKNKAPYYEETIDLVKSSLNIETDSIVELNANILSKTCSYLEIPLNLEIFSLMNLSIEDATYPGEWALNISKALGAEEYINPYSGFELFKPKQFLQENISLKFIANNLSQYDRKRQKFEAGLSIIDVMMFNNIDDINKLIDDFKLLSKKDLEKIYYNKKD